MEPRLARKEQVNKLNHQNQLRGRATATERYLAGDELASSEKTSSADFPYLEERLGAAAVSVLELTHDYGTWQVLFKCDITTGLSFG